MIDNFELCPCQFSEEFRYKDCVYGEPQHSIDEELELCEVYGQPLDERKVCKSFGVSDKSK